MKPKPALFYRQKDSQIRRSHGLSEVAKEKVLGVRQAKKNEREELEDLVKKFDKRITKCKPGKRPRHHKQAFPRNV